jgi:sodium-dependent dicarboxylate transporter 2/3/5
MKLLDWKKMIIGFGLFLFAMLLFLTGGKDLFWNAIALGGLMVYFWVFEAIPIYVTALFPMVLAIPLGLLKPADLAAAYGNSNVYLFFGGFILALGLEKWDVHTQIAQRIISIVGKSKPRILLGFILSTGLLSMWISNTATALMMLPMAIGIVNALPLEARKGKFPLFLLLSVAYAASIGGIGTLVGSPPNIQMASILQENYGISLDFLSWMKVGMPVSLAMLLLTFAFFYFAMGTERKEKKVDFSLHKKPWTTNQIRVLLIFGVVVVLWTMKGFLSGTFGFKYTDENAALLGAMSLFLLPGSDKKALLQWKDTEKLPWGILVLFGGGLALAAMFERNGVIAELTGVFANFTGVPIFYLLLVIVVIAIFATEIMSNLALVTLFVPLVAEFALVSGYPILQLTIPLAIGSSCAFMLPVGTPPNAIVFSSGEIHIYQMAKYGFVLNVVGVILVTLISYFFLK